MIQLGKVFTNTDSKVALERALSWSDLAIKLEDNMQYIDTKANLLYRLGRKEEAMAFQKQAIKKSNEDIKAGGGGFPEFEDNLKKMENGVPTWPINK